MMRPSKFSNLKLLKPKDKEKMGDTNSKGQIKSMNYNIKQIVLKNKCKSISIKDYLRLINNLL